MSEAAGLGPDGPLTNRSLMNVYECASNDPGVPQVWGYTDQLSYQAGDTLCLHLNTSSPELTIDILRDGGSLASVHRATVPGQFRETPPDCSVKGCDWPVGYELAIPEDWPSGGYRIRLSAGSGTETVSSDHWFALRAGPDQPKGDILQIAATSTWLAYNDWGGSNHYDGITGPNGDPVCA